MSNVENMVQEVSSKEVLDNEASAMVWFMYVTIKSLAVGLDKEKFVNAFRQITETEGSYELDCIIDEILAELATIDDMSYEDLTNRSKKYKVTESSIGERTARMLMSYQALMADFEEEPVEEN